MDTWEQAELRTQLIQARGTTETRQIPVLRHGMGHIPALGRHIPNKEPSPATRKGAPRRRAGLSCTKRLRAAGRSDPAPPRAAPARNHHSIPNKTGHRDTAPPRTLPPSATAAQQHNPSAHALGTEADPSSSFPLESIPEPGWMWRVTAAGGSQQPVQLCPEHSLSSSVLSTAGREGRMESRPPSAAGRCQKGSSATKAFPALPEVTARLKAFNQPQTGHKIPQLQLVSYPQQVFHRPLVARWF